MGTDKQMEEMQYRDNPYLKQFGFTAEDSMVQMKGKGLNPHKLGYASNGTCMAQISRQLSAVYYPPTAKYLSMVDYLSPEDYRSAIQYSAAMDFISAAEDADCSR